MGLFSEIYKNTISTAPRIYGESLLKAAKGSKDKPITLDDFSEREQKALKKMLEEDYKQRLKDYAYPPEKLLEIAAEYEEDAKKIQQWRQHTGKEYWNHQPSPELSLKRAEEYRKAAQGVLPSDFAFSYHNYATNPDPEVDLTNVLGRFRYKVDPATKGFQVYDTYDFSNPARQGRVDAYEKMGSLEKFKEAMTDWFKRGNTGALGEAYLGNKGVPVDIRFSDPSYKDPFGDSTR